MTHHIRTHCSISIKNIRPEEAIHHLTWSRDIWGSRWKEKVDSHTVVQQLAVVMISLIPSSSEIDISSVLCHRKRRDAIASSRLSLCSRERCTNPSASVWENLNRWHGRTNCTIDDNEDGPERHANRTLSQGPVLTSHFQPSLTSHFLKLNALFYKLIRVSASQGKGAPGSDDQIYLISLFTVWEVRDCISKCFTVLLNVGRTSAPTKVPN